MLFLYFLGVTAYKDLQSREDTRNGAWQQEGWDEVVYYTGESSRGDYNVILFLGFVQLEVLTNNIMNFKSWSIFFLKTLNWEHTKNRSTFLPSSSHSTYGFQDHDPD